MAKIVITITIIILKKYIDSNQERTASTIFNTPYKHHLKQLKLTAPRRQLDFPPRKNKRLPAHQKAREYSLIRIFATPSRSNNSFSTTNTDEFLN